MEPSDINQTAVTEFFLLGFQGGQHFRNVLFLLFLVVFCITICGNLLIITLVFTSRNLHTPMYFFISQLSVSDILLPTDIVPNLLHILLNNGGNINFVACFTQFCVFDALEAFEFCLLTVMSYDRYVAICNPLHYTSIMTNTFCVKLIFICYIVGFLVSFITTITSAKLHFCGFNVVDHFFCDPVPLLELSCSDTFIVYLEVYSIGTPLIIITTTITVMSYTSIISAILRITSGTRRQKAFSTCSSHLTVVSIFFWSVFSVYVVPTKVKFSTISKVASLLYTVFTPLINPIIYSFRNEDIKKAVQETVHKHY